MAGKLARSKITVWIITIVGLWLALCPGVYKKPPVNADTVFCRAAAASQNTQQHMVSYVLFGRSNTINSNCTQNVISRNKLIGLVRNNYRLLLAGEDKVGKYNVWSLCLLPKQRHFPWKQIWVDKDTYRVIASRDWNSQNRIKKSTFPSSTPIKPNFTKGNICLFDNVPSHFYVPIGFQYSGHSFEDGMNCFTYTDGLFAIDIYINKTHQKITSSKTSISDSGQGLIYSTYKNSHKVRIIGDLPEEELQKIANSIN